MVSKLGLHIIEPYREKTYDAKICETSPCLIKVVGNPAEICLLAGYAASMHNRRDVTFVARIWDLDKQVSDIMKTGRSAIEAASIMTNRLAHIVPQLGLDYVYFECGPNEPHVQDDGVIDEVDLRWLDDYYYYVVSALATKSIKTCSYNFSVCNPPLAAWALLDKSLAAIRVAGPELAIVGLHQYGLECSMMAHADDGEDARVLRHRCIPEIAGLKTALTECGQEPGWRRCENVEEYFADLVWLDHELQKDEDVIGAAVFTLDHKPDWEHHRIVGGVANALFAYWEQENAGGPIEVPPQPAPPAPQPGDKVAVKTIAGGQNIRRCPSVASHEFIVGDLARNEVAYINNNDRISIGYPKSWVYAKAPRAEGWLAAWLLKEI